LICGQAIGGWLGAKDSAAYGISGGDMVGIYSSVPAPPGLVLLGIGFAATAGYFVWWPRKPSAAPSG